MCSSDLPKTPKPLTLKKYYNIYYKANIYENSVKVFHYNSWDLIIIIEKHLMLLILNFFIISCWINRKQIIFWTFILLNEKVLSVNRSFLNRIKLLHFLIFWLYTLKIVCKFILICFIIPVFIIEIRFWMLLISILFHLLFLSRLLLLLQLYLILTMSKC